MKKFIMTSPYQSAGKLGKGFYNAVDNEKLSLGRETSFPIISVINGYAEREENIEVIVILADYENAKYNLGLLEKELDEICNDKKIGYTLTPIDIPYNDLVETQLELFEKLVDSTADGDTLYCCITYGSKSVPIIQTMTLHYAMRARKNVSVECVVYGAMDHNNGKMNIYDITSLLYLDEMLNVMAEQKIENPINKIRELLK